MVNLSPDLVLDGVWKSGCIYDNDTIRCFSHIHAWQLSGIHVYPISGIFRGHPGLINMVLPIAMINKEEVQPSYHKIMLGMEKW